MANKYGNLLRDTAIVLGIVACLGFAADIVTPLANGIGLEQALFNALSIVVLVVVPLGAVCLVPIFVLWRRSKKNPENTE